ncbi:hypothetical protein HJD18_03380 [Thermoleophilia bacterium SCSIO 60948]|nr:hypothetical protein HJD18_03380 [Thermoleophilia bacterium SCSIO 60948]
MGSTGDDRFRIQATPDEVEAWSDQRLPFEATGWKRTLRDELRTSIRSLRASTGEGVRAIFSSESRELVDAENVLVYNLGASCFRAIATASLAIERSFAAPPPDPDGRRWRQHHRYLVEPATALHRCWTRSTTLGRFNAGDLEGLNESPKTSALWWAIKHGAIEPSAPLGRGELFGLEIELTSSRQVNLAAVIKPIVDAAVVAFEAHADPVSAAHVAPLLARTVPAETAQIERVLLDRSSAVLGVGSIVRPRRPSGQWNPADDRIAALRITHRATTATRAAVSGELFAVGAAS